MTEEEINRIIENHYLEINIRINNFQGWQSKIEEGLDDLHSLRSTLVNTTSKANKIINQSRFMTDYLKNVERHYKEYSNLIKKESKLLERLQKKNAVLKMEIRRLERKVDEITDITDEL